MSLDLDPRVKRFQALKAAAKAKAIAKKAAEDAIAEGIQRVKQVSPQLTDKQARQVYEAHLRQLKPQTINVGQKSVKVFRA